MIDEKGYLNLKPEQTNIFFKLMEERYRRKPTIITTTSTTPSGAPTPPMTRLFFLCLRSRGGTSTRGASPARSSTRSSPPTPAWALS